MTAVTYVIDGVHPGSGAVEAAARVLRAGGLALFPTDASYAVGSMARVGTSVSAGIDRLFALKRRGRGPSFPWLVSCAADLDVYGTGVSKEARLLAEKIWPGSLTIVVRASAAVPRVLAREDGTVALRLSGSPVVAALIGACGVPLVATSANTHGARPPVSFDRIERSLVSGVDVALDGGPIAGGGPSTIVDCTTRVPRVLREGSVPLELLEEALDAEVALV